jgi:alpha-maltose-1-phosphate synthase
MAYDSKKIHVIGTRGFPHIQGGVEKHCESLYPLIGQAGYHVTIFRRAPYLVNSHSGESYYKNVTFKDLWTVQNRFLETIIHSFLAAVTCLFDRPNIVHIHNIGPAIILPILKLGGLSTVVTYHSANYTHRKWGIIAKSALRFGEFLTMKLADHVIFVSRLQQEKLSKTNTHFIPNGVNLETPSNDTDFLSRAGLRKNKYVLAVGRLSPEKGLLDLINAFQEVEGDFQLVIAGDSDHETTYSKTIKQLAEQDERIVLTGYISGESLNQVFTNARYFVLPSHQEGLPIALLEAMSYNLPVLVTDIPANKEITLSSDSYFRCGDVADLATKLNRQLAEPASHGKTYNYQQYIEEKFNWPKVAEQTIFVYERVLQNHPAC